VLYVHVSEVEGDGHGYDIESINQEGESIFIEVKTTTNDAGISDLGFLREMN
jgi:hypothetical protein